MQDDTCFVLFTRLLMTVGRKKGEVAGGRKQLAKQFHLPESTFYKAMTRLCNEGIVNRSSNGKYTIYTICNWHKYQERGEQNKELSGNRTGTGREHSNKKENKKRSIGTFKIPEWLEPELSEFVKMRKGMKQGSMTDKAIELLVKQLEKMYPLDQKSQKLCLEQSIVNSWKGVYELKDSFVAKKEKSWF